MTEHEHCPGCRCTPGRTYDLPPRWEGLAVVWEPWELAPRMFICPPIADDGCCKCGSQPATLMARGVVADSPLVSHDKLRIWNDIPPLHRRGLRSMGSARLSVFRCTTCKQDTVVDYEGSVWHLDESDYGSRGA